MKASARLQSAPPCPGAPQALGLAGSSQPPTPGARAGTPGSVPHTPEHPHTCSGSGAARGRCTERTLLASGDRAHHACARARGDGTATRSLGVAAILFRASRRRLWAVPGESALGLCGLLVPGRVASRVASFLPVPGVALAALSPGARGQVSPPGSPPPPGGPRCHPVMAAGAGHGGH